MSVCVKHEYTPAHILVVPQLAQAKALEIEGLLERLADINSRMASQTGTASDTQGHTLSNHRDKLADYQQVKLCVCQVVWEIRS